MKKRELIVGAIALSGSMAGMVSMEAAYAALTCKDAATAAETLTCSGDTGGTTYLAQALNFTGSNGVAINESDGTTGVALCGWHISGKSSYGLTTAGGSMVSRAATGKAVDAASGCAQ